MTTAAARISVGLTLNGLVNKCTQTGSQRPMGHPVPGADSDGLAVVQFETAHFRVLLEALVGFLGKKILPPQLFYTLVIITEAIGFINEHNRSRYFFFKKKTQNFLILKKVNKFFLSSNSLRK